MAKLAPDRNKYRYSFKVSVLGRKAKGHSRLTVGEYGLASLEGHWITANQIESARKVISKYTKKIGKLIINIFPNMPKSAKPLEVRMGSGKGPVDHWVAPTKEGTIMFELIGISREVAHKALKAASYKLPIRCKIVSKEDE